MGDGHCRRVGSATTQKGHVVVGRHALRPTEHRHPAGIQRRTDTIGPDIDDLGVLMVGVGQEASLAAGERLGVHPDVVQGHAHERHGLAFTGRDEHVHLTARVDNRHLAGQPQQLVGLLAHGRDHEDHLVATPHGAGNVIGHLAHAIRIRDRGASELLDDECHGAPRYRRPMRRLLQVPGGHRSDRPAPSLRR